MEDPGLFLVYAAYLPDATARRCRRRWRRRSPACATSRSTPAELDKAKNQLAAGFVFGLQTVDGVATRLGEAQYVEGDWHRFVEGATRYLAVTAADVQRVARKYLVDTNLTRVTLVPPERRRRGAAGPGAAGPKSNRSRGGQVIRGRRSPRRRLPVLLRSAASGLRGERAAEAARVARIDRGAVRVGARQAGRAGRLDLLDRPHRSDRWLRRRRSRRRWRSPRSIASR